MNEIWAHLEESLVKLVYSSNFIEVTGSDFAVTEDLCRRVLRGHDISAEIEPGPEYEQARAALITLKRSSSPEDVTRSRQEVINHIQALVFAIQHFVLDGEPVTESFLKDIHTRLCAGKVLHEEAGGPGEYRTWEIAARHGADMKKKSIFIRASAVPRYMADLVEDLHRDLMNDERNESTDSVDLASRYCHRLYARSVAILGGNEDERQEYLDLARRANKKFHEEDMEVPETEKQGHLELANLILKYIITVGVPEAGTVHSEEV